MSNAHDRLDNALPSLSNSVCTTDLDDARTLEDAGLIEIEDIDRRRNRVVVFFELTSLGEQYHEELFQV